MDVSVAYLRNANGLDMDTRVELAELMARRINLNPRVVLFRVFLGRWNSSESIPMEGAFVRIVEKYEPLGIHINFEKITNDIVFENNWSPKDLADCLLEADVHLVPTLMHQNCLGRGGSDNWRMDTVVEQLSRLRFHLGSPSGIFVCCPLLIQNIAELYHLLYPLGLCAPFEVVSIADKEISHFDLNKIQL
jgi:hypothetical protein